MQERSWNASSLDGLPPEQRTEILSQLTDEEIEQLLNDWRFWARPEQVAPPGDWLVWTYLAGRGAGKTRSGVEWVRERLKAGCGRIAMIAPTAGDGRDVLVEGVSGILSVCWEQDKTFKGVLLGRPEYEPSKRRLTWANGAMATLFSAEEPDRLRGPQHDALLADELAAWYEPQSAWDMAMFGLRLGDRPRAMVTTTPKPIPIIRELVRDPKNIVTKGTTWDNRANLAESFFGQVVAKYQGTRLGRQELSGEILEEAEGALWRRDMIQFVPKAPPLARIVVGVDPPAATSGESALCGIVVSGIGYDRKGYVLADYSGRMTPGQWGEKVVKAFDDFKADRIIAESNQGGQMVGHTIQTVRRGLPVTLVHASHSKQARAEPVAALYEQNLVFHVGDGFSELEDQMATWEPLTGMASPDRLDALVWGLTHLAIGQGGPVFIANEDNFTVDDIRLPGLWPRIAAVDMDTSTFAAMWAAIDRKNDTIYIYEAVEDPRTALAIHAQTVTSRGRWVPVIYDPKARTSREEGLTTASALIDLGVNIQTAEIDFAAAIDDIAGRLATNRLKVFKTATKWIMSYRRLGRSEKGELAKDADHLMRATALIILAGLGLAVTEARANESQGYEGFDDYSGRSSITGY